MRNAIIGIVLSSILVITMVTLYGLETKTTRQNELDANLSSAMKSTLQVMVLDPVYTIDRGGSDEMAADFLESLLVRMNSRSEYEVDILAADAGKGILSARVTETYPSIFEHRTVSATKTVVLDGVRNSSDEGCKVTFYTELQDGALKNPVRQVILDEGTRLAGFEPLTPIKKGYSFKGWKHGEQIYTSLADVEVNEDIDFIAVWEKDAEGAS